MNKILKKYAKGSIVVFFVCACILCYAQTGLKQNKDSSLFWQWDFGHSMQQKDLTTLIRSLDSQQQVKIEQYFLGFSAQLDTLHIDILNKEFSRRYFSNAEILVYSKYYLRPEKSLLFETIGDMMLEKIFKKLDQMLQEKVVNPEDPEVAYLIMRLADNSKFINLEVSNSTKTWRYLKQGRFDYVWHKLTTTYLREFVQFMLTVAALFLLLFYRKIIFHIKRKFFNH